MSETGRRELLQPGVHFGHQTRRWNPRMRRYIHGERDGIHIIDLLQTEELLDRGARLRRRDRRPGRHGPLRRHQEAGPRRVKEWADRSGMPYVNQRWLGGLLTNFQTISKRIDRLHELDRLKDGRPARPAARPRSGCRWRPSWRSSSYNLGGVRDMQRLPQAIVIIDLKTEAIAVAEAERLRIPIIGLVDSNFDPVPRRLSDPRQRRRDPLLRPGHPHPRRGDRGRRARPTARPRPSAGPRRRSAAGARRSEKRQREEEEQRPQGGRGGRRRGRPAGRRSKASRPQQAPPAAAPQAPRGAAARSGAQADPRRGRSSPTAERRAEGGLS